MCVREREGEREGAREGVSQGQNRQGKDAREQRKDNGKKMKDKE